MPDDRRLLAAVMLTDMVGYSALTQRDERLALDLVREQEEILRPLVSAFGGRVVKSLGDGLLVEFASALDAVSCALKIQQAIQARNAALPGEEIVLRIGVHLGDVVHRDDDVFGDAVNIVARIEAHAEAGGICATRHIYDQVRDKLPASFRAMGAPRLKNIEQPIELYSIAPLPAGTDETADVAGRRGAANAARDDRLRRVVVLPFASMSADPDDDYFADGMTEELIEKLAHVAGLRVIARTTAMHYKGSHDTARQIGHALDVGMVLEASVRKAAKRVRITAQLIEASSEEHLWAGRYDRELDDVFAVQDEIAEQIAHAISVHLSARGGTIELTPAQPQPDTSDMDAYTDFLQARKLLNDKASDATIRRALALFERAVVRDPGFARARVGIADCYGWLASEGSLPLHDSQRRAREELARALSANDALAEAHASLSLLMLGDEDYAGANREARRAIELNPSSSEPYRTLAQLAAGSGDIDETVRLLEEARNVDPLNINVLAFLGRAYFYAGRVADAIAHWDATEPLVAFRTNQHRTEYHLGRGDYEAAEQSLREMERLRPGNGWSLAFRGFLAARQGDAETARRCIEALAELDPDGAASGFLAGFVYFALGDLDNFWERMEREDWAIPVLEMLYSPLFASVRDQPRFHRFQEKWCSEVRNAVRSPGVGPARPTSAFTPGPGGVRAC